MLKQFVKWNDFEGAEWKVCQGQVICSECYEKIYVFTPLTRQIGLVCKEVMLG